MTRVLLTGGSGFIANHILELLLSRGHSVVTTVRSRSKADTIGRAHPNAGDKLKIVFVEDVAQEGAFDKAVVADPPFEAVIHTASPFRYNVNDIQKELLDPAIVGTTGILHSIKQFAPSVKRVVITSSFASIMDAGAGDAPGKTYTEADWNPITHEEALKDPVLGYRASKTFAEQAAWNFVEQEKPGFTIATICPPLVFGPVVEYLNSLDALNTSNQRIRDYIQGKSRDADDKPMHEALYIWAAVQDVAKAHVDAMEQPGAANKRFFSVAGVFSNRKMVDIIRKNFPEYEDKLPPKTWKGGDLPKEGVYSVDNTRTTELIGGKWISLEECVVETVKSLKAVGA